MQKHRFSSENWRGFLSFNMYYLLRKTVLLLVVVTNSSLRIKLIKILYWSLLAPRRPPPEEPTSIGGCTGQRKMKWEWVRMDFFLFAFSGIILV